MTKYNTGNPIGSADPRDLYDNSENLDEAINGTASTWVDRLGVPRKTWHGMESEFVAAQADKQHRFNLLLANSGYEYLADYAAGIEITEYNQVLRDAAGELWRAAATTTLPYTTDGTGLPEGGAFVAVGDADIRNDLAAGVGAGKGGLLVAGAVIYVDTFADLQALDAGGLVAGQAASVRGSEFRWDGGEWSPSGIVNAASFGFHVDGSSENNTTAIKEAVVAANGLPVNVMAEHDFAMGRLDLTSQDVDISFLGKGMADVNLGSPNVNVTNKHTVVLNVNSLSRESVQINQRASLYWRASVSSSENYSVGDTIRIVADDVDTRTAGGGIPDGPESRRVGENASVVAIEEGGIYLDNLEDPDLYQTNVRIGKVPNYRVSIKGYKVRSNYNYTSSVLSVSSVKDGYFELEIENHGRIASQATGCVDCHFVLKGSGRGGRDENNNNILGYFLNNLSSTRSKIKINSHGWRHASTSNITVTVENDERLERYGVTRDQLVYDSVAVAPQGNPWDDHAGAVRSIWRNCKTYGEQKSGALQNCAYAMRGRDSKIIGGYVDDSFERAVRVNTQALGVQEVIGLESKSPVLEGSFSEPLSASLVLRSCYVESSASRLMHIDNMKVTIEGGEYKHVDQNVDFRSSIFIGDNAELFLANSPLLHRTGSGSSYRIFSFSPGTSPGAIYGKFRGSNEGSPIQRYFLNDNSRPVKIYVAAHWVSGERPSLETQSGSSEDELSIYTDNDGYLSTRGEADTEDGFRRLFSICQ